jgi:hypothetical protein
MNFYLSGKGESVQVEHAMMKYNKSRLPNRGLELWRNGFLKCSLRTSAA